MQRWTLLQEANQHILNENYFTQNKEIDISILLRPNKLPQESPWTEREEQLLKALVLQFGFNDWEFIAARILDKTSN